MKTITIILPIVFLYTLLFSSDAYSQNTPPVNQNEIEALKSKVNTLEAEHSKEFNDRIDRAVNTHLGDIVKTWGATFGLITSVIIVILGFFGYKSGTNYIQEFIKNRVVEITDKTIETKVKEVVKSEYSKIALKQNVLLVEYQLEKISIRSDQSRDYKKALIDLEMQLSEALATENKDLIGRYLDQMILMNYLTYNNEGIAKLIEAYDGKFPFSYRSWANAAIAYLDLYELYGPTTTIYRDWVLRGVDMSLKLLPGYGTALAVLLILHMIDYLDAAGDEEKSKKKTEVGELMKRINSGSDPVTPFDTYQYLDRIKNRYGKYTDELFNLYPEHTNEMIKRYNEYREKMSNIG